MNIFHVWTSPTLVKQIANRVRLALPDSLVFEGTERVWIHTPLTEAQVRLGLVNDLPWITRDLRQSR